MFPQELFPWGLFVNVVRCGKPNSKPPIWEYFIPPILVELWIGFTKLLYHFCMNHIAAQPCYPPPVTLMLALAERC